MRYIFRLCMIVAIVMSLMPGCSGKGDSNPTVPGSEIGEAAVGEGMKRSIGAAGNRWVWGLWDVRIPADRSTVDVAPVRIAAMHLNVVRLIEVTPCHDCLRIGNITPVAPNTIDVDVTLVHPFPGLDKYTGFDVRGVFISEGNFTFPSSGRMIALGTDMPVLLNPDGYTSLFNPTESPPTTPPALGYIPGKYSTGGDLTSTLNPFLAYHRDMPRRMFEAGGSETRTFRLYAPTGPIHFGYAVDASWQLVQGEITDPLADFPPDANCLEAYKISVEIPYDINSSWMSQNPINVEVFDHQGLETISTVTIEAPDIFSGEASLSLSIQTSEDSWLFSGFIVNELEAVHGTYPLLVQVTDTETDPHFGSISAWTTVPAHVKEGWARTWGGENSDDSEGIAVDSLGNIYVIGEYRDTVDFNPGSGEDLHTSNGNSDIFLSKFDSSGRFQWALVWGGDSYDFIKDVDIDNSHNIYVVGYFDGTVDFDPGSEVDNHTSSGSWDIFLSKFDSSGVFKWARTWGGVRTDQGRGVAVDESGNAYVTGNFRNIVDFNPGDEIDNYASNGWDDIFVSKFDAEGSFLWARTWGGTGYDYGESVAVDISSNSYITGEYCDTVDFNPGDDKDYHTSCGLNDVFLSKLDSVGGYAWTRTWGGTKKDKGTCVVIEASNSVCVAGTFGKTVDFNPESGVDNHTSNGETDVFLSKFDLNGCFEWACTWGGVQYDYAASIAVSLPYGIQVTGHFLSIVDFDPDDGGIDNHESNGSFDIYVSKFNLSGNFEWARTFGGSDFDYGCSVECDSLGNIYSTGYFHSEAVDFDPGIGTDIHPTNGSPGIFVSKLLPNGYW